MIAIDTNSPIPLYEQVKGGVIGLVATGQMRPGDQLPGIRSLAEVLVVNPNTIARAYRELIHENFVEARRGQGNFISAQAHTITQSALGESRVHLQEAYQMARRSGLSWEDIQAVMNASREMEPPSS